MKRMGLVSIVIPTYNQAGFLENAIESALAQDYDNLEIIVSDDCSTDGTREVVNAYSDSRLRYELSPRNLGRVANYRRGLYELARGDWVLNLDGDDFLVDSTFVRAAIRAQDESTSMVFADCYICDLHVNPHSFPSGAASSARPDQLDGTSYVLSLPSKDLRIHHLAVLYRRSEAVRIDFYRANILSCDYESIFRLALGRTIVHIPARVAVWRRHPGNASRVNDTDEWIRNFQLFQGVRDFAVEKLGESHRHSFDAWLDKNVANRYYGNMLNCCRNGDVAGLRKISGFVRSRYPSSLRIALTSPKILMRCFLALASGIASRLFLRAKANRA